MSSTVQYLPKFCAVVTCGFDQIKKSHAAKERGVRAIAKIMMVAMLWGATGLFAAMGLQVYLGVDGLILSCGSLSVAIGMALLQITTLSEEGRNMFYEGIKPDEDYLNLGVVLLWGGPLILIFLGTVWWVIGQLTS